MEVGMVRLPAMAPENPAQQGNEQQEPEQREEDAEGEESHMVPAGPGNGEDIDGSARLIGTPPYDLDGLEAVAPTPIVTAPMGAYANTKRNRGQDADGRQGREPDSPVHFDSPPPVIAGMSRCVRAVVEEL
jgi:hypothetical protein